MKANINNKYSQEVYMKFKAEYERKTVTADEALRL
jgi:hypothetical protein